MEDVFEKENSLTAYQLVLTWIFLLRKFMMHTLQQYSNPATCITSANVFVIGSLWLLCIYRFSYISQLCMLKHKHPSKEKS